MSTVYKKWFLTLIVMGLATEENIRAAHALGKLTQEEADALIIVLNA